MTDSEKNELPLLEDAEPDSGYGPYEGLRLQSCLDCGRYLVHRDDCVTMRLDPELDESNREMYEPPSQEDVEKWFESLTVVSIGDILSE